jgi:hypothetical protein
MKVVSIDRGQGLYSLAGPNANLYVWQNLPGWTDSPGRVLQLTLPDWARTVEVWGWDGLRRRMAVTGGKYTISGLDENETLMIRVLGDRQRSHRLQP